MGDYDLVTPLAPQLDTPLGSTLHWEDLTFEVADRKILKGVSGGVPAGRLCAIMGPSGAGKSTMLNALAGRLSGQGKVGGKVFLDGRKIDPISFRTKIAYVMQEDALFATQTPREAFHFSAALRLPSTVTFNERHTLVEQMLDELGLQKCADTFIGSILIKGISGGEKKRTAIGVELISNPKILFLDEPTSGLDSYAAYTVVSILQTLARAGTSIICTIHQPSSEVFDLFDETLLLADGQLMYHAPVSSMTQYFAEAGHECRANYNPADFVMFLMQKANPSELEALAERWEGHTKELQPDGGLASVAVAVAVDAGKGANHPVLERRSSSMLHTMKQQDRRGGKANVCTQFSFLAQREVRNVMRDKVSLIARIATTVFLNLVVGLVFKEACNWDQQKVDDLANPLKAAAVIQNHFGAIVQIGIGGLFGLSQPTLLSFPLERPVFLREYATGTYAAWPYFVSKLMAEVPLAIGQSSLIFLTTFWLLGIQGNFLWLTLATALTGMTAASCSLLIGSAVSNVQAAIQLTPLVFVPQLLFAGVFISIDAIPKFMRWAQYLCSLKYGINLLMIAEFSNPPPSWPANNSLDQYNYQVFGCYNPVDKQCLPGTLNNTQALFPRSEVEPGSEWVYFGVLIAVFCGFRLLACCILASKANHS